MSYFSIKALSNSFLKSKGAQVPSHLTAIVIGNYLDAIVTEPDRFTTIYGDVFFENDGSFEMVDAAHYKNAVAMRDSLFASTFWQKLQKHKLNFQNEKVATYCLEKRQFVFDGSGDINVKSKADIILKEMAIGIDLKTMLATTQIGFEKLVKTAGYDRQAVFYMQMFQLTHFIICGVSKVAPHNVFVVSLQRNSAAYNLLKDKIDNKIAEFNEKGLLNQFKNA